MRIGIHSFSTGPTFEEQIQVAVDAERHGLDSCWYGQIFGHDALTLAALAGRETQRIELGTAVAQTHSRHPFHMAIQAVTVQAATEGRFSLGIGPSHKVLVQDMLGLPYDQAAAHVREYLSVLIPLLNDGRVVYGGERYRVAGALQIPDAKPCPVLISGLAPMMLRLAGEVADGTILAWAGPRTIETFYVPRINEAAEAVGRPRPRVCALVPVAVTDDVAAAREQAAITFEVYGRLPNYQRVLAREGATTPAELAVVGDETSVERQLREVADAGATDLIAWVYPVGEDKALSLDRTWALLGGLAGEI
ncbi:MAG: TIGR03564 family F420-dependent LLM class oxidoreductase [Dehalococcoidia bacterium]